MKIKVLEKTKGCMPEVFKVGDWIDLRTAEEVVLTGPYAKMLHRKKRDNELERLRDVLFDSKIIPLGVCIKVPKGFECIVAPRSSTFKKYGILQTNSIGVIDNLYCGNDDEWKMPVIATRPVTIPAGTRLAQFRMQLSQKATMWQKIKAMFSSSLVIVEVDSLDDNSRGGFGEGTNSKH